MATREKIWMRIMLALPVFIVIFVAVRSNSQTVKIWDGDNASQTDNYAYINPTPGEIPVVASSPWVDGRPSSLDEIEDIRNCGFNCVLSLTSLSHFNKVDPLLRKAGLKIILGLPEFSTDKWRAIIDTLKYNPVIGAWRVTDEPRVEDFSHVEILYEELQRTDSTHLPYVNLVGPGGGKNYFGKNGTFQTYIEDFQREFKPGVWSYDFYPIKLSDGKFIVDYASFYKAFELFSGVSVATGRPFWAYCQTMAFSNKYYERPPATVATLSFEAFSALGYGAKGLVYWTYCMRKSNDHETYKSALVDLDCKKSDAWYAAQQVNQEIKALTHVFLNTSYGGTWHTGSNQPAMCKKFVPGTECLLNVKGGGKGYQISRLYDAGNNYLVIVNKDVENKQKLTLTFDKSYEVTSLTPEKVGKEYKIVEKKLKNSYKTTLNPGRYLILRYKNNVKIRLLLRESHLDSRSQD